jgi:hypothetical protein
MAYRKLGVRSRSELTGRWRADTGALSSADQAPGSPGPVD